MKNFLKFKTRNTGKIFFSDTLVGQTHYKMISCNIWLPVVIHRSKTRNNALDVFWGIETIIMLLSRQPQNKTFRPVSHSLAPNFMKIFFIMRLPYQCIGEEDFTCITRFELKKIFQISLKNNCFGLYYFTKCLIYLTLYLINIIFFILKEPHAKSFKIFLIWSLLLWKNHLFSQSDLLLVYF